MEQEHFLAKKDVNKRLAIIVLDLDINRNIFCLYFNL